jgi:hypothetical protein
VPGDWIDRLDFKSLETVSEAHPRDGTGIRYDEEGGLASTWRAADEQPDKRHRRRCSGRSSTSSAKAPRGWVHPAEVLEVDEPELLEELHSVCCRGSA